MTVSKEMPFCPAFTGWKERGAHSLVPAQSVLWILPHTLRSVLQRLQGEVGRGRPWYMFGSLGAEELWGVEWERKLLRFVIVITYEVRCRAVPPPWRFLTLLALLA